MKVGVILSLATSVILGSSLFNGIKAYAMSPLEAVEKYKADIISSSRKTGVWASVTAAQLILESGNPMSDLATEDNNFFGIKWAEAYKTKYPGSFPVSYSTKEDYGGGEVSTSAIFTHFPSVTDGITEHSIIWWNGHYEPELKILEDLGSSMDSFLREMGNGPYATDSSYYYKLRKVIDDNNLEDLDKLAFPEGRKFCGFGDRRVGKYEYPDDDFNAGVGEKVIGSNGLSYVIVKEEDLVGMYPKSFFLDDSKSISLPSYDNLSLKEKNNLNLIKDNFQEQYSWNVWDLLRVCSVFLGLCILVYAVVFIAGFLFDKSNNIIDLSLIAILSLGHLQYSEEEVDIKGYVNQSRLIKIELALFVVGFFLVGGGLFSILIDIMWNMQRLFA